MIEKELVDHAIELVGGHPGAIAAAPACIAWAATGPPARIFSMVLRRLHVRSAIWLRRRLTHVRRPRDVRRRPSAVGETAAGWTGTP